MLDYQNINHVDKVMKLQEEIYLLHDRINAWEIFFEDLCDAIGQPFDGWISEAAVKDVLDAVKDLKKFHGRVTVSDARSHGWVG